MNDMSQRPREDQWKPATPPDEEPQPLGRMLQTLRGLSDAQIDEIVEYQRSHGL